MNGIALAHDYLTQRGGAERVALMMAQAFNSAPLYTTLYEPGGTFPEFAAVDIRTSRLNKVALLRSRHRLAMPALAQAVSAMHVEADVLLASSSGWAHGISTSGRKIVYCHAPARWLYQRDRYLGTSTNEQIPMRLRRAPATLALDAMGSSLRRWDRRAASSADVYLANSTVTRDSIRAVYGIDAEIIPPPPALLPGGAEEPMPGVDDGYVLCVARLLPYKNVDAVITAAAQMPHARLIVVGTGPELPRLQRMAANLPNVRLMGRVEDAQLRWLYRHCSALVAASYEDYGLSPLEAAEFGKPTVALNAGGYLDTVVDGTTGLFFDNPVPAEIWTALQVASAMTWDSEVLRAHAAKFSAARFRQRLRRVVGVTDSDEDTLADDSASHAPTLR